MTKTNTFFLSTGIVAFVCAGLLMFAGSAQATAGVGDDVKCETFSAVYNIGEDGKRHPYPNEKIWNTHHANFDHVKIVSCETLSGISLGDSVKYDPGKRLIKAPSVPTVYAVAPGGILRALPDEATAIEVYGTDWAKRVDDISEAFLSQYTLGDAHPSSQLLEGSVLVGADGKLLRADASGFAIEVEDLLTEEERELMHRYALDMEGVEERFERTIHKIPVSDRTDEQTLEYEIKYKVIIIDDNEKIEIEIEIEEATEEEKEFDRSKIEIEIEVEHEDDHVDDERDEDRKDEGATDDERDDASDDQQKDEDEHSDEDKDEEKKDDDVSDDSSDDTESDSGSEERDEASTPTPASLEVQFTQPAGGVVAYPGSEDVVLGQYTFGAATGDVQIEDIDITLLIQDVPSSSAFAVGTDGSAAAQQHLDDCKLVEDTSGLVYSGPLGTAWIGATTMNFTDDFAVLGGTKVTLNLTCDMTSVEPHDGSDSLAFVIDSASDVSAEDSTTGGPATVIQVTTNGNPPSYFVELLETAPYDLLVELHQFSPSGAAIPGLGSVLRFNVTAGTGGDVDLVQLPFSLTATDNNGSDWNHCGDVGGGPMWAEDTNFAVYNINDLSTPIDIGWEFYGASGASCVTGGVYAQEDLVDVIAEVSDSVAAGSTETYLLYIDTTNASAAGNDSLRVDIDDETSFIWSDGSFKHDAVGVDNLPITGGTQVY